MSDEKCRILFNAMWKNCIMAILNLKTARDKYPPIRDLCKTDFKVGDMVLIKNHTLKDAFDSNINLVFEFAREFQTKCLIENKFAFTLWNI